VHSRRAQVLIAALVATLIAFPLGALASHQFGDVLDSNIYHDDIDAIADAGVTTGCGGGNYCPSAFVTREQMAAFMNRLGALGPGKVPVVNAATLDGVAATQFVRSDVQVERHYSCTGPMFESILSTDAWTKTSSSIYATAGAATAFACPIHVPDGSTISAVHFWVSDASSTEQVKDCALRAGGLSGAVVLFSDLVDTGLAATPGTFELVQSGLSVVVDNTDRAYYGLCTIEGNGDDVRIVSLLVDYLALEGS
jgi:hypothetical protein